MAGKTKVVKSAASNVTKNVTDFDKKVYEFCSKIPKGVLLACSINNIE